VVDALHSGEYVFQVLQNIFWLLAIGFFNEFSEFKEFNEFKDWHIAIFLIFPNFSIAA